MASKTLAPALWSAGYPPTHFEAVISSRHDGIAGEVAETLAVDVRGFLQAFEFGRGQSDRSNYARRISTQPTPATAAQHRQGGIGDLAHARPPRINI